MPGGGKQKRLGLKSGCRTSPGARWLLIAIWSAGGFLVRRGNSTNDVLCRVPENQHHSPFKNRTRTEQGGSKMLRMGPTLFITDDIN